MGSGVPHRLPSYCRKNRVQVVLGKAITGRLPAAVPKQTEAVTQRSCRSLWVSPDSPFYAQTLLR